MQGREQYRVKNSGDYIITKWFYTWLYMLMMAVPGVKVYIVSGKRILNNFG